MRGWNAEIHKGTLLNAYVNGDQTVTLGDIAPSLLPTSSPSALKDNSNVTAALLGLKVTTWAGGGAEITEIAPESVADLANLHVGDVITSVDGKHIGSPMELEAELQHRHPESQVRLGYLLRSSLGYFGKETIVISKK